MIWEIRNRKGGPSNIVSTGIAASAIKAQQVIEMDTTSKELAPIISTTDVFHGIAMNDAADGETVQYLGYDPDLVVVMDFTDPTDYAVTDLFDHFDVTINGTTGEMTLLLTAVHPVFKLIGVEYRPENPTTPLAVCVPILARSSFMNVVPV